MRVTAKLYDYLLWRAVFLKPRLHRALSRLVYPAREGFYTFGFAPAYIHCQKELGVYRIGRAATRLRYLR